MLFAVSGVCKLPPVEARPQKDAQAVLGLYRQHLNPSWAALVDFMGYGFVEARAEGCYVYDQSGQAWLDCLGGPGVFTMGHNCPAVREAVTRQLKQMPLSSHLLLNARTAELAARLAQVTPGDLQYVFFGNSGAEAVEAALKVARAATGRPHFVAAEGGFHGKTFGALSASGRDVYKQPFEPLLPGFRHVPFGEAEALQEAVNEQTAAVILEPIQCEAGIIIPSDDYLGQVRAACDAAGAMLILDEIQTGLARTGRWFACEWWGVAPDIMCLGKALGGGVMPIGAIVARAELWRVFDDNPLLHSSTFGGNPLACAAGVAALEVIEREGLCQRAEVRGRQLLQGMTEAAKQWPELVREVRGKGLLVGVEFADADVGGLVIAGLSQRRILCAYGLNDPRTLRFEPPAVITEAEVERVVEQFGESVAQAAEIVAATQT